MVSEILIIPPPQTLDEEEYLIRLHIKAEVNARNDSKILTGLEIVEKDSIWVPGWVFLQQIIRGSSRAGPLLNRKNRLLMIQSVRSSGKLKACSGTVTYYNKW